MSHRKLSSKISRPQISPQEDEFYRRQNEEIFKDLRPDFLAHSKSFLTPKELYLQISRLVNNIYFKDGTTSTSFTQSELNKYYGEKLKELTTVQEGNNDENVKQEQEDEDTDSEDDFEKDDLFI